MQLISQRRKIQKNKRILTRLDREVLVFAKRFLAVSSFLFCSLILTDAFQNHDYLIMVTLTGLVLFTSALHGYFVLNFSNLYAHGSHRWRKKYFLGISLNLLAWNVVLATLLYSTTFTVTPIAVLLLLTCVLNLSLLKVFSPYGGISKILISLAFLPNILAAFTLPFYGNLVMLALDAMLLSGLLLLCEHLNTLYWDKEEVAEELRNSSQKTAAPSKEKSNTDELHHEFIKNLSQELKTALNDNLGCLALLKDAALPDGQRELLILAEQASERQLELINNVVDFNRITQKQIPLELSYFNIRRELEDAIRELSSDAANQSVEINTIINRNIPQRIKSDLGRLKQILRALVTNIVRFSEQGSVLIEADCISKGENNGTLSIRVIDEGVGAVGSSSQDLFNAFVKIKHSQAGTGLGLAICKGLAECLDGEVGYENKNGVGKEVWLKLPVEVKEGQHQNFGANPKLQDLRLLLVNPPIKIQKHLIVEFESWGLIVEVIGANRTIEKYLSEAADQGLGFNAIVMFSRFKEEATWQQGYKIAKNPRFSHIPQFIAASGSQIKNYLTREHLLEYPQINVISRPIQFEPLHQMFVDCILNQDRCIVRRGNTKANSELTDSGSILVVEDHRVNQMVAEGMLKKLGYLPTIASSGEEALKLIAQEEFDLVLMDCQMAGMDGYQTTEAIRITEEGDGDHLPIVALTAHTAEEDKSKCLAVGMDDFLSKPVRYSELESCLRRWIGGKVVPINNNLSARSNI